MNKDEVIAKLKKIVTDDEGDYENQHLEADRLLCAFLISLGYSDVVEAWKKVGKWYA